MGKIEKKHIILLIVLFIALLIVPQFISNDYYILIFNRIFINAIVVLGLNFITGLTGQMNLGMAGIFALGAYSSALVSRNLNTSPWIGMIAAILIGLIIGRTLGYPSLRVKGVYLSLTTIGFAEVVRMLISNLTNFTGGTQGIRNIKPYRIFGFEFNTQIRMYYLFFICLVIALFIAWRIVNSKWGRVFKSLRDNVEAVEMSGVNIAEIKIKAFTACAIYGSIAGALYAHFMGYINPSTFSIDFSTNFVIMLVIGGLGSVFGNIIGAAIVTVLPELLKFLGDYYLITFSVIVLIGAIFFPRGWVVLFLDIVKKIKGAIISLRRKEVS